MSAFRGESISDAVPFVREDVLAQLDRILASNAFKSSKRCGAFIKYVTIQTLAGQQQLLKERVLGVEIFGRTAGYDTQDDPVVRNTAGEVRKRLAQYYQEDGHTDELRIDLPPGFYTPSFRVIARPVEPVQPALKSHKRLWIGSGIAAVCAGVAIVAWLNWRVNPVDAFWAPLINSPGPVLMCIGQPGAFNLQHPLAELVEDQMDSPTWFKEHAKEPLFIRDLLPYKNRYVTLPDAIALARITALLVQKSKPFHIRGSGSTSFSDVRENAIILIGAFSNDWTVKLGNETRFYFHRDAKTQEQGILDRQNPSNRSWVLVRPWPEWDVVEDYALVSRVLVRETGHTMVSAAGITTFGTFAAGEFVTNPAYLAEAMKQAPPGWKRQNMQVVLATKIVEHGAGPPRIVATHFW